MQSDIIEYENQSVLVFLTNGVKLTGTIVSHSQEALKLRKNDVNQTVFYQAIATIMPQSYGE